jgi:hypothetical protein
MADRYGRAGGNWSTAGTWSASSGGGSDGAGINAGDAVILDANSSGTFTIDTSISIVTLVCTGFTGTLAHNNVTLTVSGNTFTLAAGMTYAPSSGRIILFTSTGTVLITTAGKTLGSPQFNGTGGTFQLQDALTYNAGGTLTLTAGTLDCNNQNVTGGLFSSTGTGVARTLSRGSGTWTMNAQGGTVWDCTSAAGNLTLTAETSPLIFSSAPTGDRTVQFGTSKTYSSVTFASSGSTPGMLLVFANTGVTLTALSITAPVNIRFSSTATYTISNAVTWAGTSTSNAILLCSGLVVPTLAMNGGTAAWTGFQGLTFSGTPPTTSNSFDFKGNSGITINAPSAGGVVGVIGS